MGVETAAMETADSLHMEVVVVLLLVVSHNWDSLLEILLQLVPTPHQPLLVSNSSIAETLYGFPTVIRLHLDLEGLSRLLAFRVLL